MRDVHVATGGIAVINARPFNDVPGNLNHPAGAAQTDTYSTFEVGTIDRPLLYANKMGRSVRFRVQPGYELLVKRILRPRQKPR